VSSAPPAASQEPENHLVHQCTIYHPSITHLLHPKQTPNTHVTITTIHHPIPLPLYHHRPLTSIIGANIEDVTEEDTTYGTSNRMIAAKLGSSVASSVVDGAWLSKTIVGVQETNEKKWY
jgi:hypothetical protein